MINNIYAVEGNINYGTPLDSEKHIEVNYNRFKNSNRYSTNKPIREICDSCDKPKCKCGGCGDTDFYHIVAVTNNLPSCQRCLCNDNKPVDNTENINDSGKSLDELINQRRGKTLRKFTMKDYENGDVSITREERLSKTRSKAAIKNGGSK